VGDPVARRITERIRYRLPIIFVTTVSVALNCWALSIQGLGNQYYAAAARSMTQSWSNFFFVSFDPGGFISVDKPPVALWITAASARIFGFNSWSLLLPGALAGAGAVAVLWCTVHRRFGTVAATIAGLVLALSPISVAVNRLNLPEPFMILFLVSAAWAVLRSFDSRRGLGWVALAGVFLGLAFNTKMLAAFIPLPAIGAALLVGTAGWRSKLVRGCVLAVTTLVVSLSWMLVVDLTPSQSRPYVGGSTNNTVRDLVFGYNGFGRVTGGGGAGAGAMRGGAGPGAGSMGASGGVFGGAAGPSRLLSDALGGQIAWVLPLAAVGLAAAIWYHRRDRERRAALVLWGGWLALYGVVFSYAGGTFHAYYTATMAPAIAALVGIGAAVLLLSVRRDPWWFVVIGVVVVVTVGLQMGLMAREPEFFGWIWVLLMAGMALMAAGLVVGILMRHGRVIVAALAIGMAALVLAPAAWSVSEAGNTVLNATLPQAGPRSGQAGNTFGSASSNGDTALGRFLAARNSGETWDLVVASAQSGSGYIAYDGLSVMALGGFMGTDNTTTVSHVADLVATGQVRFFATGDRGVAGARSGPMGAGSASQVMSVVRQVCAEVTTESSGGQLPARYDGTIYDCAGRADAFRSASVTTQRR